ncbi:hypothetical protein [Catenulispora subtropica]|uniref:DUF4397 domain-containing protein n=1 Tax=Catenulispora subtropica TaxID=450798 RepID=A0ABN2RDW1_9ACTN
MISLAATAGLAAGHHSTERALQAVGLDELDRVRFAQHRPSGLSFNLYDAATNRLAGGQVSCFGGGTGADNVVSPIIVPNPGTYTVLTIPENGTTTGTVTTQLYAGGAGTTGIPTGAASTVLGIAAPGESALATIATTAPDQTPTSSAHRRTRSRRSAASPSCTATSPRTVP